MATRRKTVAEVVVTIDAPFVGYGRNSKLGTRERGNNASIDVQRAEIPRIAAVHSLPFDGTIFEEEDTSGATFEREEWNRIIELIRARKAAGIIAYDLDRASRGKTAEVLFAVEEIEALGGAVYDRGGRISVSNADSELLTTVKAMVNRAEWRKRQGYNATAVRRAIESGVHLQVPFGYERSNGKGSPLAIVEREARAVRFAFEERASGSSWQKIANALNATGVLPRPHKRDGEILQAVWNAKTVRQTVGSEVYTGVAFNGDLRKEDAHPAIVSKDLYSSANRARGTKPNRPTSGYLLSGLVRCARCGYVGAHSVEKGRGYYRCKRASCPERFTVSEIALDEIVRRAFKSELCGVRLAAAVDNAPVAEAEERVAAAGRNLGAKLDAVEALVDVSASERRIFEERLEAARAELREAEVALGAAQMAARGLDLPADLTADSFDELDVDDQRHLVSLVFGAVVVRRPNPTDEVVDDRVLLVPRDEAPLHSTGLIRFVEALDF